MNMLRANRLHRATVNLTQEVVLVLVEGIAMGLAEPRDAMVALPTTTEFTSPLLEARFPSIRGELQIQSPSDLFQKPKTMRESMAHQSKEETCWSPVKTAGPL
jgi:hypothetical protein